jgi:hypothetical protein
MPTSAKMAPSQNFDQPVPADGGELPPMDPSVPGDGPAGNPGPDGLTPERLKQVIERMESGFYDSDDVREQIARKVRKELDP